MEDVNQEQESLLHKIVGEHTISVYKPFKDFNNNYLPTKNFEQASNNELQLWFVISTELLDFSVLGNGVRFYVTRLYDICNHEVKKRNLDYFTTLEEFICEKP